MFDRILDTPLMTAINTATITFITIVFRSAFRTLSNI